MFKSRLHAHYQVYTDSSHSIKHQVFVHVFIYFTNRNIVFVDCIFLVGWLICFYSPIDHSTKKWDETAVPKRHL